MGECITFVPWKYFEKFKHTNGKAREEEYLDMKEEIIKKLLK